MSTIAVIVCDDIDPWRYSYVKIYEEKDFPEVTWNVLKKYVRDPIGDDLPIGCANHLDNDLELKDFIEKNGKKVNKINKPCDIAIFCIG